MSRKWLSVLGLVGFTSKPMVAAFGSNSCSNSNCFPTSSLLKNATPVALPPG
jgi:hypothetical protein